MHSFIHTYIHQCINASHNGSSYYIIHLFILVCMHMYIHVLIHTYIHTFIQPKIYSFNSCYNYQSFVVWNGRKWTIFSATTSWQLQGQVTPLQPHPTMLHSEPTSCEGVTRRVVFVPLSGRVRSAADRLICGCSIFRVAGEDACEVEWRHRCRTAGRYPQVSCRQRTNFSSGNLLCIHTYILNYIVCRTYYIH